MVKRKKMSGEEFVERVVFGQRYFPKITVLPGSNLRDSPYYRKMQQRLRHSDCERDPLVLDNAKLEKVYIGSLYAPFIQARNLSLRGAYISKAILAYGNLEGVDLSDAYIKGANFAGTNFLGGDFSRAVVHASNLGESVFSDARLRDVDLFENDFKAANFEGAIFDDVRGLETSLNLKNAEGLQEIKTSFPEGLWIMDAQARSPDLADLEAEELRKLFKRNYDEIVDEHCIRRFMSFTNNRDTFLGLDIELGKPYLKIARHVRNGDALLNGEARKILQFNNEILGVARRVYTSDVLRGDEECQMSEAA